MNKLPLKVRIASLRKTVADLQEMERDGILSEIGAANLRALVNGPMSIIDDQEKLFNEHTGAVSDWLLEILAALGLPPETPIKEIAPRIKSIADAGEAWKLQAHDHEDHLIETLDAFEEYITTGGYAQRALIERMRGTL